MAGDNDSSRNGEVGDIRDAEEYAHETLAKVSAYARAPRRPFGYKREDLGLAWEVDGRETYVWRTIDFDTRSGQRFRGVSLLVNPGCGCELSLPRGWFDSLPRAELWEALERVADPDAAGLHHTVGNHLRVEYGGAMAWRLRFSTCPAVAISLDHTLLAAVLTTLLETAVYFTGLRGWRLPPLAVP